MEIKTTTNTNWDLQNHKNLQIKYRDGNNANYPQSFNRQWTNLNQEHFPIAVGDIKNIFQAGKTFACTLKDIQDIYKIYKNVFKFAFMKQLFP